MAWNDELKRYFQGRSELSRQELAAEFGLSGDGAAGHLEESLLVFQQEYGVPVSVLRPADRLDLFTTPPKTRNPIRWLFARAAYEDSTSEPNYRLKKRRRILAHQTESSPMTIGEYVAAWLGSEG